MSVRINLEIAHEAALRSKLTAEGYTHDWEIYVKGCDNADIQYYVEKVVFHLHNSFANPKRVVKDPPYRVRESGYASFSLPIEIYLRNNEKPKKIRFTYDLTLQTTGPVAKVQKEKYVFYNPNEDFRRKLMKGGAVEWGSSSDSARDSSAAEKLNKLKSNNADIVKNKHRVKEHKAEDSFRDLFGTPITKTSKVITEPKPPVKPPPVAAPAVDVNNLVKIEKNSNPKKSKSKHSPKEKDRDKEKKDKNPEEKKKHKEEKKSKERSKDKERKDKSAKREKSPKQSSESPNRSPKQRPPSPKRPPSPPPVKIKEEKKDESKKSRHEQKDKEKDKKEHKSHKEKDVVRNSEQKEHKSSNKEIKVPKEPAVFKTKEKPIKEEPVLIKEEKIEKPKFEKVEVEKIDKSDKPEKTKHKHKKKDSKEKKEKKEEKTKDKKSEKKIEKAEFFERVYKEEPKVSTSEVVEKNSIVKPQETSPDRNNIRDKSRALSALHAELVNDSSNSSIESVEEPIEIPPKIIPKEPKKKDKSKIEIAEKKQRKRKNDENTNSKEETPIKIDEPPVKIVKNDEEPPQIKQEVKPDEMSEEEMQEMPLNYMNMLRELQHKIMTLQDNNELQQVVQLIAETGQFEITAQTFDFDLCTLDRNTVQKLQEFFAIS